MRKQEAEEMVPMVVTTQAASVCDSFGIPLIHDGYRVLVPASMTGLVSQLIYIDYVVEQVRAVEQHLETQRINSLKASFLEKFPKASKETVELLYRGQTRTYSSLQETPLEYLTAEEIDELNWTVEARSMPS